MDARLPQERPQERPPPQERPSSARKLQLMRPQQQQQRSPRDPAIVYPERLDPGDDKDDDVASAHGVQAHMNQSMFSLIAAAGSRTDFHPRFGEVSSGSDSEREAVDHGGRPGTKPRRSHEGRGVQDQAPSSKQEAAQTKAVDSVNKATLVLQDEEVQNQQNDESKPRRSGKSRQKESKLQKSLPRLRVKSQREKNYMSQSMILPGRGPGSPKASPRPLTPRDAPVMRRIIEAEARADPDQADAASTEKPLGDDNNTTEDAIARQSIDSRPKLMSKLKEIFGFDELEEVVSEYPCWLLQSVLLQGYLYITEKHFCFYAYLPKKSKTVIKSGSLMKKVKRGPKYNRQWFVLKGDILSYYDGPASLYFQVGYVDLRFATSAALDDSKDDSKDTKNFIIATPNRTYYFTADSSSSAKDWVKMLQKVIFRTHNDGDSVKISLPVANIVDIEESPVIEVAKTVKVRVVESNETFALDEYYFSFFSFGQDAISVMQSMVADTLAQRLSDHLSPRATGDNQHHASNTRPLTSTSDDSAGLEAVRARTNRPKTPEAGRPSSPGSPDSMIRSPPGDASRPPQDEASRKSVSPGAHGRGMVSADNQSPTSTARRDIKDSGSEFSPLMRASDRSESFVDSIMASSGPNLSGDDFTGSGSQVLSRSDIFRPQSSRYPESPDASEDEDKPQGVIATTKKAESRSATPRLPAALAGKELASSPVDADTQSPSITKIIKAGQYPLQRAAGLAGMLHRGSKDMSTLIASKGMGYMEKVSGMWAGGRQHYSHGEEGLEGLDDDALADARDHEQASGRFRSHFGLPESERLLAAYFGFLHRVLPLYGKIYVSDKYFCFRSLLPGTNTKIILPLRDIETVHKEKGFRLRYSGLVVVIQGFEELFFEFNQREVRDDCAVFLHRCLDASKILGESMHSSMEEEHAIQAKAEHKALMEARHDGKNVHDLVLPKLEDNVNAEAAPVVRFDDPKASILNFKPTQSLKITCLTIGSRGDVQPYIALCKGLLAEGHKPKIASHAEFEPWVRKHGIEFESIDGDPAELMRICVENGMFTYSFLREASSKFRGWIDDLLSSAWKACQGSDLLIESPSAMAGIHIAEALQIPYFRAFTMPWTRTRAYPHAFAVPEHRMGGAYNWLTYVMFDNVFWAAISGQVNRWRKRELKLPSTTLEKLHPNKVPFLYNFSPSVVAPPIDFSDWVRVTGYWFLDEGEGYQPDEVLVSFIKKARADGKKLVYIGFGSIVVSNPKALTDSVVESVLKTDVRCILSKGWSDRLGKESDRSEAPLPPDILQIKSCPHDWLFKQVDCAVHHGGAGTTGASLRAGLPTIVKPFFGDQFFFGNRIEDLQVGIYLRKLNVSVLSRAIWEATHSERMIAKATVLGQQIRKEDGVGNAIQAIYRDMDYARSLIKNTGGTGGGAEIFGTGEDQELGDEESWTFVGDEAIPDLKERIAAWDGYRRHYGNEAGEGNLAEGSDREDAEIAGTSPTSPRRKGNERGDGASSGVRQPKEEEDQLAPGQTVKVGPAGSQTDDRGKSGTTTKKKSKSKDKDRDTAVKNPAGRA